MGIDYKPESDTWEEDGVTVTPGVVEKRLRRTEDERDCLQDVTTVSNTVVGLWEQGELSPEETLNRQMLRIQELRDEIGRVTAERDRQYDENVNRIAAQGAAELEAAKWEWVARQYEKFCYSHSWMPTVADLLYEFEEEGQPYVYQPERLF